MDSTTPGSNSENINQSQQATGQQQQQQQQRGQQRQQAHSTRRNADLTASAAPTLAQLRSSRGPPGAGRSRAVKQEASPAGNSSTDGGSASKSLPRSRLPALSAPGGAQPPAAAPAAAARAPGFSAQLFSVFTNPLSASGAAADAEHSSSRAAASIPAADSPVQAAEPGDHNLAPPSQQPAAAPAEAGVEAADSTQLAVSTSCSMHAAGKDTAELQGAATYCFEVQAASRSEHEEHLIDYNGHDQHATQQQMLGPNGQLLQQQLGGNIQQYVYDEDTGQLCGTGEGTQTTRLGRHYLEDCHTGEFFQLAQQPTGGLWAWLRHGRRLGADGWFRGVGVQGDLQQQHEPGFLHSLSDFLDTMASGMAALGLFAQGLAGGLALLCLFMTYIQYATAGREAFLAFYSPQAEMVNRTFFTLISISLVAAAARHAYDQLGNFLPRHLRLGLVDSLVMLLYFLAYTCNLLATPLDDQLAFEAHRDPGFYTLLLPAAFERRLGLWHGLNLVRVVACGLAWVLVCYRSNHFVMLRVFEARRAEQEELEQQQQYTVPHGALHRQGVTTGSSQAAAAGSAVSLGSTADAAAAGRRLARLGSYAALQGSFAADRGESMQWPVPSKRLSDQRR